MGTAHTPQCSRWGLLPAGTRDMVTACDLEPSGGRRLPRPCPGPWRPGGLAGRFRVCTPSLLSPRPPEMDRWTARPRRSAVAGLTCLQAGGNSTGYREPADGPSGVLPLWGPQLIFSNESISLVHASSPPVSSVQTGAGSPWWGLQTPLIEGSPWRRAPGKCPQPAVLLYEPRRAQGQRESHGHGTLSQAGLYGGWTTGGALLPGVPWPATSLCTPALPTPLWGNDARLHPPLLPGGAAGSQDGPPALQLGPSWKTTPQGAPGHDPGPCQGCPEPAAQEQGVPGAAATPRPSQQHQHHSRRPGRSPGRSACLGPQPAQITPFPRGPLLGPQTRCATRAGTPRVCTLPASSPALCPLPTPDPLPSRQRPLLPTGCARPNDPS